MKETKPYLPAAGEDWALPLYDPCVKLLGGEAARRTLVEQAALGPGHRVLDLGCGTGTLVILIKRLFPPAQVAGIDPDPRALARARRKAARAGALIQFERGLADALPFADASFDRVFSSFMFHHLRAEQRAQTLREVRRVLAPGGRFHLLDFVRLEGPGAPWWRGLLTSNAHFQDNFPSRILALLADAGFRSAEKSADGSLLFGLLPTAYFRAAV